MKKVKIEILKSFAGVNFSYIPGDKPEVDEEQAKEWIKIGYAKPIKTIETTESKAFKSREKALKKDKNTN